MRIETLVKLKFSFIWQKSDFWAKNGQIWPKTDIFGQISSFLAHFIQCPTKKQFEQVAQVVLLLCGYQNFTYSHRN